MKKYFWISILFCLMSLGCSDSDKSYHSSTSSAPVRTVSYPTPSERNVISDDEPGEIAFFAHGGRKIEVDLFEGEVDSEGFLTEIEWDFNLFEEYYTMKVLRSFQEFGANASFYVNKPENFVMAGKGWRLVKSNLELTLTIGEVESSRRLYPKNRKKQ